MNKQRICFITPDCKFGGAERVLQTIITSTLNNYDVQLIVLTGSKSEFNKYWSINCDIHFLNCKSTKYSVIKLYSLISKLSPNFVFSTRYHSNILCLFLSFFTRSVEFVIREPNMPSNCVMPSYFKYLIRILYSRADKIIAQTSSMKSELITYYNLKNSLIRVITNPVDTMRIDSLLKNELDFEKFDPKVYNIVSVGRLVYDKGFDNLIKAVSLLANKSFHLYILGEGPEKDLLEKLITKHNLNDKVFLVGFVENPYKYIKKSDLFVLSSRKEGLPNVLLESMYLKKNIVSTSCVPFVKEVLGECNSAQIIPVDDIVNLATSIEYFMNNDIPIDYDFNFEKFNPDLIFARICSVK